MVDLIRLAEWQIVDVEPADLLDLTATPGGEGGVLRHPRDQVQPHRLVVDHLLCNRGGSVTAAPTGRWSPALQQRRIRYSRTDWSLITCSATEEDQVQRHRLIVDHLLCNRGGSGTAAPTDRWSPALQQRRPETQDPWHFETDPHPWIRTLAHWILLFSSVAFKMPSKNKFFCFLMYFPLRYIYISLQR